MTTLIGILGITLLGLQIKKFAGLKLNTEVEEVTPERKINKIRRNKVRALIRKKMAA